MTKIGRQVFTAGFKLEAVRMAKNKGFSVPEVCASVGICETALRRGLVQYEADRLGKRGPDKPITPVQQRIRELEIEPRQANLDNEP